MLPIYRNSVPLSGKLTRSLLLLLSLFALAVTCILLKVNSTLHSQRWLQEQTRSMDELAQLVETTATTSQQQLLEGSVNFLYGTADLFYSYLLNGQLTEQEAKAEVLKVVKAVNHNSTVQLCILGQSATGISPALPDTRVARLIRQHNLSQLATPEPRYLELEGHAQQTGTPQFFAVYQRHFPCWEWNIAGAMDMQRFAAGNLEDVLRRFAESTPLGPNGFAFILTPGMPHPRQSLSLASGQNELEFVAREISFKEEGREVYQWPQDEMHDQTDRVVLFRRLQKFGITLGIIVNAEIDPWVSHREARSFLVPILLAFILVGLAGYLLFRFVLAKRFAVLAEKFKTTPVEGLRLTDLNSNDEADVLESVFEQFLLYHQHQRKLIKEKKQEVKKLEAQLKNQQVSSRENLDNLRAEITSKKVAHEKLSHEVATRKSAEVYLQLFKNIFDSASSGIMITNPDAKILAVNQAFTTLTGYSQAEAIGRSPKMLSSGRHTPDFYKEMWQTLVKTGHWSGEVWNRKKDGAIFPEWMAINCIREKTGEISNYCCFMHDMTEIKKKERVISFMTFHDALTKLPNRDSLEIRMAEAISQAQRAGKMLAVCFIDLDNFKNINDSMGHDKGDKLLIMVAKRLQTMISDEDTLSRLGGDEFIILAENVNSESEIFTLASRILASLTDAFELNSRNLYITASIGISLYPDDGVTCQELIKNADLAMYRAKNEGRNKCVMFTSEMNDRLKQDLHIESAIRTALENKEFITFYQPKVCTRTEKVTSMEALIRWKMGETYISPNEFIPVAEKSGLIDEIGLYVLKETCQFLTKLKKSGLDVPISLNLSPRTFNNDELVETINEIIDAYQIGYQSIEFEITETTAMQDVKHTIKVMQRFRQRGISFAIDDFGTGYSSLSYLNVMPVNTLKIDKRFISADQDNSRGIVSTIVAISQQMGLNVVAEGVETEDQLQWLRKIGCNEIQGYYYSKPLHPKQALHYLEHNR
ncbi:MAG: hypothetical protein CSA34_07440 [Desulfobulbus propionicus]|nr:MAG: hypothetical protein CSA34_07440 [Desulfobulbus propionicus]